MTIEALPRLEGSLSKHAIYRIADFLEFEGAPLEFSRAARECASRLERDEEVILPTDLRGVLKSCASGNDFESLDFTEAAHAFRQLGPS